MKYALSKKLLFVHIPRTGGGSLINILDDHYDVADIAPFWNPQDFARDEAHDLKKYRLVRGHCGPNEIERLGDSQYATITFLRDPVARTASIYRWLRTLDVAEEIKDGAAVAQAYGADTPTFDPKSQDAIEAARSLSFEDFIEVDVATDFVSNGQTINLGSPPLEPGFGIDLHSWEQFRDDEVQRHTLPRALSFLERCLMVGIIERYAESVILLHYLMGWHLAPMAPNFHDTKAHVGMTKLTDHARDAVALRNQADISLYEFARVRFQEQFDRMANDLGTDDVREMPSAVNARYRENFFRERSPVSFVQVTAGAEWPGTGWSARKFLGGGRYARSIGADDVVTLSVLLDPTVDFGKPRILSLCLQECIDVDPAKDIRVDIDGQVLEFGGNGPLTGQDNGLPTLYPYYWGVPFGKIYQHEGRIELNIRLVDVNASAHVYVGAFEVTL